MEKAKNPEGYGVYRNDGKLRLLAIPTIDEMQKMITFAIEQLKVEQKRAARLAKIARHRLSKLEKKKKQQEAGDDPSQL